MPVLSPLPGLVEESFDESTFLWGRWEAALDSHTRNLAGLSFWVEERLLGALAGVRAGGERGLRQLGLLAAHETEAAKAAGTAPATVSGTTPAAIATATFLLASTVGENSVSHLLAHLRQGEGARLPAMARGLELAATDLLLARLESEFADVDDERAVFPLQARVVLQGTATPFVLRALVSRSPLVQEAAFRALRHFSGDKLAERELVPGLVSPHAKVRAAAIETGLVLGSGAAWSRCVELAAKPGADDETPLLLCALFGEDAHRRPVFAALGEPAARVAALQALGFLGTKEAMLALLGHLEDPLLGKLAAESFCVATGLSLEAEKLVLPPPEEESLPALEDDDLDADLVPTAIDLLPLPDVEGVRRWWKAHENAFLVGERHVGGQPFSLARLQEILREGPTRRRHVAARELAIRSLGRYQVETRAFSDLQRRHMQSFSSVFSGVLSDAASGAASGAASAPSPRAPAPARL